MKKIILPLLSISLLITTCKKTENNTTSIVQKYNDIEQKSVTKDFENTTFQGTIPCADCPGISLILKLNWKNKTFEISRHYLEKPNGFFKDFGTFETSKNNEFIILKEKDNPYTEIFYITENAAYLVSKVGDKNTKEEYKLSKQD